jgi:O-acetyl-ADP-ribose deacetylase (regulator of RNase III)
MLEFVKGDFFDFDADIRINTVNCVGVMGAGVALAFKKKYPDMFKEYVKHCKEGTIRPGHPSIWKSNDMFSKGVQVINFPTKDHWRNPSEYSYIVSGLKWLSEYLSNKGDVTVTLPALGCGHGGLDWSIVKDLIKEHLGNSQSKILVFEPFSSKNAGKPSSLPDEKFHELLSSNIRTISAGSQNYPPRLRRYTEKDIYLFGQTKSIDTYDIAIVSSSVPSEAERKAITLVIEHSIKQNFSILFGASATDKNFALKAATKGIKTGVFLPSGIIISAKKILKTSTKNMLNLLSIGDPYEPFDKKAYMPSVISRIYLSNAVIFTTDKLAWISKHKKPLQDSGAEFFYIKYDNFSAEDEIGISNLNPKPISITDISSIFSFHILPLTNKYS